MSRHGYQKYVWKVVLNVSNFCTLFGSYFSIIEFSLGLMCLNPNWNDNDYLACLMTP